MAPSGCHGRLNFGAPPESDAGSVPDDKEHRQEEDSDGARENLARQDGTGSVSSDDDAEINAYAEDEMAGRNTVDDNNPGNNHSGDKIIAVSNKKVSATEAFPPKKRKGSTTCSYSPLKRKKIPRRPQHLHCQWGTLSTTIPTTANAA